LIGFMGVARRTGRFPQLVDSRSGLKLQIFATISPVETDLLISEVPRSNPNFWLLGMGIRDWLVPESVVL
jgi:hypothetical protein